MEPEILESGTEPEPGTDVAIIEPSTPKVIESEGNEYAELADFDGGDLVEVIEDQVPAVSPEPATPPAEVPSSELEVPAAASPVQATPVVEAPAAPAAEPPKAEPSQQPVATPEQRAAWAKEQRTKAVQSAKAQYEALMTDEVVERLAVNPAEVLPELLAIVAVDTFTNIAQFNLQQIPSLITHHNSNQNEVQRRENTFFQSWPNLIKPEYREKIISIGQAYRMANPEASEEQATKEIGTMVSTLVGAPAVAPSPVATPAPPHTPVSPVAGAPPPQAKNEFEEIVDFDDRNF